MPNGFADYDACSLCDGKGGDTISEWQGDGAWGCSVDFFDACPMCLAADKCPGCGAPAADALHHLDTFVCVYCLWRYDPERYAPNDEPSWGDYGE